MNRETVIDMCTAMSNAESYGDLLNSTGSVRCSVVTSMGRMGWGGRKV